MTVEKVHVCEIIILDCKHGNINIRVWIAMFVITTES